MWASLIQPQHQLRDSSPLHSISESPLLLSERYRNTSADIFSICSEIEMRSNLMVILSTEYTLYF